MSVSEPLGSTSWQRVLITGGAGFVGSHLADVLVERGCRVTIIDDLSTGRFENIQRLVQKTAAGQSRGRSTSLSRPSQIRWFLTAGSANATSA